MTRIPIPTGALLAGTAIASLPTGSIETTQAPPLSEPVGVVSSAPSEIATGDSADASATPEQTIVPLEQEWTSRMEKQFLRFAEKEALSQLTRQERAELDRLSSLRYALKVPRKGEKILKEFQQRQIMNDLLMALQRYVQFVKTPRN